MVHRARVDGWLAALVGGVALLEVAAAAVVVGLGLAKGEPEPAAALGIGSALAAAGVVMGLVLWGCYRTRYEIAIPDLVVRFGPFRTTVPLDAIVEVFPTRNPLSAPAPSLDRLRINYRTKRGGTWFALVSPKDKEGFVRDLASAAPQLRGAADEPLRLKAEAAG